MLAINNEFQFNEATELKYFGSMITCNNIVEAEINGQLTARNICYFSLRNILKSSVISRITKFVKLL